MEFTKQEIFTIEDTAESIKPEDHKTALAQMLAINMALHKQKVIKKIFCPRCFDVSQKLYECKLCSVSTCGTATSVP